MTGSSTLCRPCLCLTRPKTWLVLLQLLDFRPCVSRSTPVRFPPACFREWFYSFTSGVLKNGQIHANHNYTAILRGSWSYLRKVVLSFSFATLPSSKSFLTGHQEFVVPPTVQKGTSICLPLCLINPLMFTSHGPSEGNWV